MPNLFAPGAVLGLGLRSVRALERISKRNGLANLNQAIFGIICLVSLKSSSVFLL